MAQDLLEILRNCVEKKCQIKEVNEQVLLGGQYFPKRAVTSFPIQKPKGDKQTEYYKLDEILFFMENRNLPHSEYLKKAKERKIGCVRRPDRKRLLFCIFGESGVKTRSSARQQPSQVTGSPSFVPKDTLPSLSSPSPEVVKRKLQIDRSNCEVKKQRSNLRTYSRKRSPHQFSRPDSRNEDQSFDMDTNTSTFEELDLIKNENMAMDQALKSMTSFLKDHLGVTDDQMNIIQNSESNTVDLSNVASEVRSNIVHAGVFSSTESPSQTKFDIPRQCYKAVKHPLRGWEMTKQDLSSVLSGDKGFKQVEQFSDHEAASLNESLSKGSILLKRAFSILISQLREYNKPLKSHDESDTFCRKVVKDCLTDAVDGFRKIFSELITSKQIENKSNSLDEWVNCSKAELEKLFNSLVMTLQSLRDISISEQKTPMSLFHFPEPTFSLALNPAKVTHSVLLEMYIRIGLAELRQILGLILNCGPETNTRHNSNANVIGEKEETEISQVAETETDTAESMEFVSPFFGSQSIEHINAPTQSTSGSEVDPSLSLSNPEFEGVTCHTNGETRSHSKTIVHHTCQPSGGECCHYSMFKTTVGNTLVSSFKKQIQEKINARDFISQ